MGIKIESLDATAPVYDITVEEHGNFFGNGILVHNCNEIYQFTDENTTAICSLSSLILKNFVKDKTFDFELLHSETRKATRALNKVIDINNYSTAKGKKGGLEQRAIAIGIQGLADVFFLMDYEFVSDESKELNNKIFETIYHAAITESMTLCKDEEYKPYKFFKGSPMSKGIFQFDMFGLNKDNLSGLYNWDKLKEDVKKHGICNSLFTASMPTASSAKITSSYEMFEPIQSNLFNRRVVGGEFIIVNKYLVTDLEELGIWSETFKNELIINDGSLQNINFNKFINIEDKNYKEKVERLEKLLRKYKIIWEISQKDLIDMAADRAPFIDQSQSMNIYMANPSISKITSSHFHAWKKGLKTLCYYLRTKAISTGAKHLAIDMSNNIEKPIIPQVTELPKKPENSEFECIGCSS